MGSCGIVLSWSGEEILVYFSLKHSTISVIPRRRYAIVSMLQSQIIDNIASLIIC